MDTDDVTSGNPWGLEPLLDVNDLAACLRVPVATAYDWRTNGKGPRAYRFGKHLMFAVSDEPCAEVLRVCRRRVTLRRVGGQVRASERLSPVQGEPLRVLTAWG